MKSLRFEAIILPEWPTERHRPAAASSVIHPLTFLGHFTVKAIPSTRPLDWIGEGQNLRPVSLDDAIKELCHSIVASGLLQPLGVIDHGDYGQPIIGFRRLAALRWGVSQDLEVPATIPVMLYPADITPEMVRIVQLTENLQRLDITDVQLYLSVAELERLGMARKDIASKLGVSAASATRYFAPDNCPPEAREHFLAERLTLGQCYQISTAANPLASMAVFLGGGTREKAGKAGKPPGDAAKERAARVKIPLAVEGEGYSANGIVTVASLPGEEIDLEGAENLLREAMRSVKEAQKKGWTVKSAMSAWRDTAALS